jgi:GTP-binding protein
VKRLAFVAIVGRPNVGKSTLFNYLVGKRISIVEDTPGVTRDRLYAEVEWTGRKFTLVDTGGIDTLSEDVLFKQMRLQAQVAIDEADLIVFLVDGRQGVTAADDEVARILRHTQKPVLLVVNKLDVPALFAHAADFCRLGLGDPVPISAANGMNIGDLLDLVVNRLPAAAPPEYGEDIVKLTVMGRPNVGKSSLVNSILGEERVIVSDIPGTTRDAVDTYFERGDSKYVIVDTAGLRKQAKVREDIERYSVMRSLRAVDKADICLMVIDATEGILEQDKKIIGYAHEKGKGIIFVVNKWDLVVKDDWTADKFKQKIYAELQFADYAPCIFVSAKTGQRVPKIVELVSAVHAEQTKRVRASVLMELVTEATVVTPPPQVRGKKLKIGYVTQTDVKPPTFLFLVNDPLLMHFSYLRFLENRIRAVYGFSGTSIRLLTRKKE